MKKFVVIFVCCFVILGFWSGYGYCRTLKDDAFKVALEAAGLSYENISWDASKLSRIDDADPFRLQWFNEIWANPLRVPKIAKQITDRIPIFATNISKELDYIFFYGTSRTCGSVAALMEDYLPLLEMAKEKPFYNSIKKSTRTWLAIWQGSTQNYLYTKGNSRKKRQMPWQNTY